MNPEMKEDNTQGMTPAAYLNSISSAGATPEIQGAPEVTQRKKWPVIVLIVLVIVLIVTWLVFVGIKSASKSENADNGETNNEQNNSDIADIAIKTLTCDKVLNNAGLASYESLPQFGKQSYFASYDGDKIRSFSQYTELTFSTSSLAEKAKEIESNSFKEYYENTLNLTEDPFESVFQWLEDGNTLNIFFNFEKEEINSNVLSHFNFPESSITQNTAIDNLRTSFENSGYTCAKLEY